MSLGEQIRVSFERIQQAIHDPVLMTKCIDVCTASGLGGEQLARLWETFLVNNTGTVKNMSLASFNKFKVDVLAKMPARTPLKGERGAEDSAGGTPSSGGASLSASLFGRYGVAAPPSAPATPMEGKKRPLPVSAPAAAAAAAAAAAGLKSEALFGGASTPSPTGGPDNYAKRRGAGEVRLHFNSQLADVLLVGASASVKKVVTMQVVDGAKPRKYMWDPLEGRATVFRETTGRLGQHLLSTHEAELDGAELGPFHLPQSEPVLCVGRIVAESGEGKLEPRGVLLEGQAPDNDSVYRVKLDLKHCPSFCLFPGQTVLLRAVNPTGQALVVRQLLGDASLSPAQTDEAAVYEQAPVRVTIAAGPFCSHENLEYRPLSDLMDAALGTGTDVLVLLGPFVEARHPEIERGAIGRTYDELFLEVLQHHVLRRVEAHNATAARGKLVQRVVLIPSLQDMHHAPVFPQFPFSGEAFSAHRDLLVLASNPAQLRINGVLFGFTSCDPLKHMGAAALLQRPTPSPDQPPPLNRMLELAGLLLDQQSFLPLNPPPPEINLDCAAQLSGLEFGEAAPQVFVLPSALKVLNWSTLFFVSSPQNVTQEFCDPLRGSLVVNPSFLVRGGSGGGTYAEVTLYPRFDEDLGQQPMDTAGDEAAAVGYQFMRRIGVKIIKI